MHVCHSCLDSCAVLRMGSVTSTSVHRSASHLLTPRRLNIHVPPPLLRVLGPSALLRRPPLRADEDVGEAPPSARVVPRHAVRQREEQRRLRGRPAQWRREQLLEHATTVVRGHIRRVSGPDVDGVMDQYNRESADDASVEGVLSSARPTSQPTRPPVRLLAHCVACNVLTDITERPPSVCWVRPPPAVPVNGGVRSTPAVQRSQGRL